MDDDEKELLISFLEDAIIDACYYEPDTGLLDSMCISSYAEALRYLAKEGRVEIIQDRGRRVIAKLKKKGESG
jgi:hypothetical protein